MFQRLLDFALNFIARNFFGVQGRREPMFDVDELFNRLGETGDRFLARLQRMMVAATAALVAGVLALSVLTVRIYQLSAERTVGVLGMSFDGALVFGVILAVFAAGFAAWILRAQNAAAGAQTGRAAAREAAPPARTASSPLEDALAAFLMHRLQEENRATAPTAQPTESPRKNEQIHAAVPPLSARPAHETDHPPLA